MQASLCEFIQSAFFSGWFQVKPVVLLLHLMVATKLAAQLKSDQYLCETQLYQFIMMLKLFYSQLMQSIHLGQVSLHPCYVSGRR